MCFLINICSGRSLWRWTLVLATLFAFTLPALAFEETLDNGIEKFKYSLSGEVTKQGSLKTTNWGSVILSERMDMEMQHGRGSILVDAGPVSGQNKDYTITVTVSFWDGSNKDAAGNVAPEGNLGNLLLVDGSGSHEKRNAKFSESIAIPEKAKYVSIEIYYTAQRSAFKVNTKYTIGGTTRTTTKKAPEAQSYKGTMTRLGSKMEYSFSGGTATNKSVKYTGYGECNMNVYVDGEVAPGSTVTASCKKLVGTNSLNEVKVDIYVTTTDGKTEFLQEKTGDEATTVSAKVPNNAKQVSMKMTYKGRMGEFNCLVNWDVVKESSTSSSNSMKWDDVGVGDRCPHCNGQFSNYFVNTFSGQVTIVCNSDPKNPRKLDATNSRLVPIYYNDYIIIEDQRGCLILDDNENVAALRMMQNSKVLLQKRLPNGMDRWVVNKGTIVGQNLKHADPTRPSFRLSECEAIPNGTTYVLEDDGKTSRVLLLEGSMDVTSNKTSKNLTLQPGQVATVSSNGQINVDRFDVSATAKKYDISGVSTPNNQANNQAKKGEVNSSDNADNTIYDVTDTQPQYPGGAEALSKYIASNIKYPADAKQQGMDGMVLIQLVVEKDGSLSNFKVMRKGKLPSLDAEALRVVKSLPKFTPGRNEKGQTVRVKYSIPVRFKL